MRYMTHGGGRWDGFDRGFLDRQIAAQAGYGVGERAARRFVMAMQFGGCTDAEAYEIMRDRYCAPHGTAFDLHQPTIFDEWFRRAWRRSHNGGPIGIDMAAARKIQIAKIGQYARDRKLELRMPTWRARIRRAQTPEELKSLWPSISPR